MKIRTKNYSNNTASATTNTIRNTTHNDNNTIHGYINTNDNNNDNNCLVHIKFTMMITSRYIQLWPQTLLATTTSNNTFKFISITEVPFNVIQYDAN